jgi:hypothetical protein
MLFTKHNDVHKTKMFLRFCYGLGLGIIKRHSYPTLVGSRMRIVNPQICLDYIRILSEIIQGFVGGVIGSFSLFLTCLVILKGLFKWCRNPDFGEMKGRSLTLTKGGCIEMNLLPKICEHNFRGLKKFDATFISK